MKRKLRGSQGTAMLEMALVLPLFLIVIFGIIEFGLIWYSRGIITNASREGARLGIVYSVPRKSAADIEGRVRSYLQDSGFNDPVSVTVSGAGGNIGDPVSVRVDYTYHFLALSSLVGQIPNNLNLSGETVMRLE